MNEYFSIEQTNSILLISFKNQVILNFSHYYGILQNISNFKNFDVIICNLDEVKSYDTFLPLSINEIRDFAIKNNFIFKIESKSQEINAFIEIYNKKDLPTLPPKEKLSKIVRYFTRIGNILITLAKDGISFMEFIGEITSKFAHLLIKPKDMRWEDFPMHLTKSGVNAVPIVILIVFLIGVISGYQGAIQLKQFGADIFVADLVGISIARELAPLMAAILVAGRSGASFAAEIGTMKVSEEIDALNSMGFDYIKFLVMPRIAAVVFAMPLITIIADFFGILGGMLTALATLNITFIGFMNEMQRSLSYGDIFSGILKSVIFGYLIATVGCFRGLQVSGGAESVGRYTTASVVTGVLLIILTDAVMIFVLQSLGI
jgi:phospholipid/cholesterol/gamma-HCH transport system permease protein